MNHLMRTKPKPCQIGIKVNLGLLVNVNLIELYKNPVDLLKIRSFFIQTSVNCHMFN